MIGFILCKSKKKLSLQKELFEYCDIMYQLSIIGMYSAQNQVHAKVGEQHAQEGKNAIDVE